MMTELLLGATLIAVTGVVQACSVRFALPQALLVASVGIACGAASLLLNMLLPHSALTFIAPLVAWPLPAQTCLTLFLPTLLFQAALSVNVREMLADAAPILLLAVFAVFVATGAIGLAASAVSGQPVIDGLLLGAIIATTDPSAVLAVFRSVGAPARLVRLVEGESLLNDATAIAVAGVLLAALEGNHATGGVGTALRVFAFSFAGGTLFGAVAGRLLAWALVHMGGEGKAELTLTIALPYPLYIVGDHYLHVSGVVAVVAAGLVVSGLGRTRLSPRNWDHLQLFWEQAAAIAGTVVFLIATIRVPALMRTAHPFDLVTLCAIVAAALAARVAVLFGVFPILARLRLSEPVSPAFKFVIAWGGLRGAVTIVLALGIAGNDDLSEPTRRFVAVLATGFVLLSLVMNGPTLKPLIRRLGLDRLSAQDRAIQRQVVRIATTGVEERVQVASKVFEIAPEIADKVVEQYRRSVALDGASNLDDLLSDQDRLAIGLLALARKERDLIPDYGYGVVKVSNLDRMTRNASDMIEAVRRDGRLGYRRRAAQILALSGMYRVSRWLHLHLRFDRLFATALADRFELLMCRRAVLEQLTRYNDERLNDLLGDRLVSMLDKLLHARIDAIEAALNEMRSQYYRYTWRLERRMLLLVALREGCASVAAMYGDQTISTEIYNSLNREFARAWEVAIARPRFS
ncbi:Na+/H+ antiporter [Caballeronia terrestris]|uniref:Na+/H+ antiporter n=1 Tax=Caballeronia terrestris TaxID=1226301 RepID=A0A158JBN9_9BURK|nr:cation:proton antiporter [Caballeronia terrestris]SAL65953.1 Na+/H+ antiporter [Caballeronia terrestris]